MSDPGSTNFPPGSNVSRTQDLSRDQDRRGARIVRTPAELRDVRKATKLQAEVIRRNEDGSLRLRTTRGAVDIKLPDQAQLPQKGEQITVEIQAGRPPTRAVILPPSTPEQIIETRPPELDTRSLQTPIDVLLRQADLSGAIADIDVKASLTAQTILPESLAPIVRIEEIPAQLAQEVLNQSAQISETILPTLDFFKDIALQNLSTSIITNLKIALPATPQGAPLVFPQAFSLQTPNILNAPLQADRSAQNQQPLIFSQRNAQTQAGFDNTQPLQSASALNTAFVFPAGQTPKQNAVATFITVQTPNITSPQVEQKNLPQAPYAKIISQTPRTLAGEKTAVNFQAAPDNAGFITHNQKAIEQPATILGRTSKNLPIVQTQMPETGRPQFFVLHFPEIFVQPGSNVFISPLSEQVLQAIQNNPAHADSPIATAQGVAFAPPIPINFFLTPEIWPSLDELFQTLQQNAPATAQAFSNITPSPANPAQLSPALLLFVAAIRGGDIQSWLGERASETLRRAGKGDLLNRVGQEARSLMRIGSEPVSQDWRTIALPFMQDQQVHKVALYYRHDYEDSEEADTSKSKQMRFIFDLKLDHMGMIQLDGLFRKRRLDLIVRTDTQFSKSMQMSMRRAYSGALVQTQVEGELSFQNASENWVKITPDHKGEGVSI